MHISILLFNQGSVVEQNICEVLNDLENDTPNLNDQTLRIIELENKLDIEKKRVEKYKSK